MLANAYSQGYKACQRQHEARQRQDDVFDAQAYDRWAMTSSAKRHLGFLFILYASALYCVKKDEVEKDEKATDPA